MPHQDDDTGINGDVDQYSSFLLESEMNFDEGEYALFPIESMSNTPGHDSTEYFTSMSSSNSDSNQDSTSSRRTSLQDQSELAFPSYNINNQCKVMGSDDEVLTAVQPKLQKPEPEFVKEEEEMMMHALDGNDIPFATFAEQDWQSILPFTAQSPEVQMQPDFDLDHASGSESSLNESASYSPQSTEQSPVPSRELSTQPQTSVTTSPTFTPPPQESSVPWGAGYIDGAIAMQTNQLLRLPDGNQVKKKATRKRKSISEKVELDVLDTERLQRASQQNKKQRPHTIPIENPNSIQPTLTWAETMRFQPYDENKIPVLPQLGMISSQDRIRLHPVCQTSSRNYPIKTRVETQISIRLLVSGLPPGVTSLHFAPRTVSRPKGLLRSPFVPSPDTLDIDAWLVTETAWVKNSKFLLSEAYRNAGRKPDRPNPNLPLRRYKVGETQEESVDKGPTVVEYGISDPNNPLNGGPVWICAGCMDRENKRSDRKKSKKPDEETEWFTLQGERVVMLTNKEMMEWIPVPPGHQKEPSGNGAWGWKNMVDTYMRIVCYCRHHHEKHGYRVIFTLKDHEGRLVSQGVSDLISVTDDHKADKEKGDKDYGNFQTMKRRKRNNATEQPEQSNLSPAKGQNSLQSESMRTDDVFSFPIPEQLPTPDPSQSPTYSRIQSPHSRPNEAHPSPFRHPESFSPPFRQTRLFSEQSPQLQHGIQDQMGSLGLAQTRPYNFMAASVSSPEMAPRPSVQSSVSPQISSSDLQFGDPQFAFPFHGNFSSPRHDASLVSQAGLLPAAVIPQLPPSALQPHLYRTPLPEVQTIIPSEGPTSGGIKICVRGSNFTPETKIIFGTSIATLDHFINDSYLIVILPVGRPGTVPVYNTENSSVHRNAIFKYVDDAEKQMMMLALSILGNKLSGRSLSGSNLARMILQHGNGQQGGSHDSGQVDASSLENRIMSSMREVDETPSSFSWELDMANEFGLTLLHLTSFTDMKVFAKELLRRNADPNLRDIHGNTPLHYAALYNRIELLEMLVANRADVNCANRDGLIPLDLTSSGTIRVLLQNLVRPRLPYPIVVGQATHSFIDHEGSFSPASEFESGASSYFVSRRSSVISNLGSVNGGSQYASMDGLINSQSGSHSMPNLATIPNEDPEQEPTQANQMYHNVRNMLNNSLQGVRERVPSFNGYNIGGNIGYLTPRAVPTYQQLRDVSTRFTPNYAQILQRFGRAATESDALPPPSYQEVCPDDELTTDEKTHYDTLMMSGALPAMLRSTPTAAETTASTSKTVTKAMTVASVAETATSSSDDITAVASSSGVEIIAKESKEELVLRRGQQQVIVTGKARKMDQMRQIVERAAPQHGPDKMLYMFWIPLLVIVMILMIWNTTQSGGGDIKLLYSLVKNTGMKVVEFVRERVREEKAQRAGYF